MSDGHAASYQVLARIDAAGGRVTINPRKANPAKAEDAKPRILVSAVAAATRVTRQPGCLAPGNKETNMRMQTRLISAALLAIAALLSNTVLADELFMEAVEYQVDIYDEAAYTEYVEIRCRSSTPCISIFVQPAASMRPDPGSHGKSFSLR